ncbi:hypothetical protein [Streptomyces sp. NPDC005435]
MPTDSRGKSTGWAKVLAAVVLLVLLPLAGWFLVSFQGARAFPW